MRQKVGDIIECHDEQELKRMLKKLSDNRYGAVRLWPFWIRITSTDEKKENEKAKRA